MKRTSNGQTRRHVRNDRVRVSVLEEFAKVVVSIPYPELSVKRIARAARVGRSSFYEHFEAKDDLLRQSLAPLLRILALAGCGRGNLAQTQAVLEHFQEHRERALAIFAIEAHDAVLCALADLLEEELERSQVAPLQTLRLRAIHIAGGQLTAITDWLRDDRGVKAAALAQIISLVSG
ncbi:MAG TPA: helix-turn-helix domain-containing protein [Candidatus Eremiobacteraceae bacterium]|nr:helix-turn-helix domain-containing protein [Candidatus Eremiobacteraceae bacterium]